MAKLGSHKFNGMELVGKSLFIEVRVEKMAEVRMRFFLTRILMWLLRKAAPCKVEYKFYEQSGKGKK